MVENVISVQDKNGIPASGWVKTNQTLMKITAWAVMAIAVSLSLYQLYTAGVVALTALVQRGIHLGAILSLAFLLKPSSSRQNLNKIPVSLFLDWILVALSVYCTFYICNNLSAIFERQGDWLDRKSVV